MQANGNWKGRKRGNPEKGRLMSEKAKALKNQLSKGSNDTGDDLDSF